MRLPWKIERIVIIFSVFFLCGFTVGCNKHVGLRGKVTFSDNGEPVPCGEIRFSTPTFLARSPIAEDGTYTMGSYKMEDGLPPGTYDVMICGASIENETTKTDRYGMPVSDITYLVDPKYEFRESSGLTATVDASTKVLNFEVDRAKPKIASK